MILSRMISFSTFDSPRFIDLMSLQPYISGMNQLRRHPWISDVIHSTFVTEFQLIFGLDNSIPSCSISKPSDLKSFSWVDGIVNEFTEYLMWEDII